MIPTKTTGPEPHPRRERTERTERTAPHAASHTGSRVTSWAAAAGALAVLVAGCAAPAADGPPALGTPAADGVPAPGTPVPTAELTEQDVNAWLDGLVPAALDGSGVPGAVVSVVHDGEILSARGYGYADTGADGGVPVPVDPEGTLFRVASVSKLFTATAVLDLLEEGTLDLDTDVHEYLDFTVPTEFDEPLTLRHLLTHTPGFEERVKGMFPDEEELPELRDFLVKDPPKQVYAPGTVPAYSNYGYALAGYIVERAVGVPFAEHVQESLLDPLGMDSATFAQPLPEDLAARAADGYADDTGPAQPFEFVSDSPAGALTASATDMARFMLAHLGEADPDTFPLSSETLDLMHSPALGEDSLGTLARGPGMTLGFFEEERAGQRLLGHGGDTLHFHSHLRIHPESGSGVFVSVNGGGYDGASYYNLIRSVTDGFVDRYLADGTDATRTGAVSTGTDATNTDAAGTADPADSGTADTDPGTPDTAGTEAAGAETAAERAAMAEGTYTSARTMHSNFLSVMDVLGGVRVQDREDGTILVTPGPATGKPMVYEEIEPWLWREVGGQSLLSMRAEGGRVEELLLNPAFTFLRIGPATAAAPMILLPSMAVLLVTVLAWPIRAVVRWRRSRRAGSNPTGDQIGQASQVSQVSQSHQTDQSRTDAGTGTGTDGVQASPGRLHHDRSDTAIDTGTDDDRFAPDHRGPRPVGADRLKRDQVGEGRKTGTRHDRMLRTLTRVGAVAALAALVSWVLVIAALLGAQNVAEGVIRAVQALQLLGILAIVPAAWTVFGDLRLRAGWGRVLGGALVLTALLVVAWFALTYGLVWLDVSY